jgi:hypothetical protein
VRSVKVMFAVVALVLAAGFTAGATTVRPAAAASYCPAVAGVNTYRWTGHAGDGLFSDRRNWSPRGVPGLATTALPTDYACIPASAEVTLQTGEEADLQAMDSRGTLQLQPGAKLFLGAKDGSATAPASRVNNLDLLQATLGGTATVTVIGTLNWTSDPENAATQTTRALEDISGGPPAFVGSTVIAVGATANITGGTNRDGGVNLRDDRSFDVLGTAVIANGGFIAADWGTAVRLLPDGSHAGRLLIENDGGIYQGFLGSALPWETHRERVVNAGRIIKQPGPKAGSSEGTSVIDADYSADDGAGHTGTVVVKSGTLTIYGTDTAATLDAGATIGFGGCPDHTAVCTASTTTTADPQAASVLLSPGPSAAASLDLAPPLATNPYNRRLVGDPVVVAGPTAQHPSIVTMRVDSHITNGATLKQMAVGVDGTVLRSCRASAAPCLLHKQTAPDDPSDYVLTVATTRPGMYVALGPRFR